jgi:hypothetical protein
MSLAAKQRYGVEIDAISDEPTRRYFGIRHRPELVLPELRKAISFIAEAAFDLHMRGYITDEMQLKPPPHWIIARGLELEVAGDTTEEDERLLEYRDALRLYRAACDEWNKIATLKRLSTKLIEEMDSLTWRPHRFAPNGDFVPGYLRNDVSLLDPEVLGALMRYGEFLRMFASGSPILAAYFHQFEAIAARVRDTVRTILIDRLFEGKMSAEDGAKAIAMLESYAASGLWPTPDLDLNKAEERALAKAAVS